MRPFAVVWLLDTTRKSILAAALASALCGALLWAARPVFGQDEKLPKAEEILDRYVEATGGKAAYAKIKNRVSKGRLEMPAQGMEGSILIYAARPNLAYSIVEIPGVVKQERGTDGKVAWERQSLTGPRLLEGSERALFMHEAAFNGELKWRALYKKVATRGVEEVEGKPAYKVELTIDDENKLIAYYDKQSHLLVKSVMTVKTHGVEMNVETFIGDYKKVDGILTAHKHHQKVMGMEQTITFDSIEVNAKIEKDRFKLPEDVKELVRQQQEAKQEKKGPVP
ncbi:MAG: hypothetical protein ACE5I3_00785 [Phycisphaerae bacterium]